MEFKKFSVRVINEVGSPISIGMNISLIHRVPRILSDIGVIETYEKDYSGFSYGVRNLGTNKISIMHISSIRPIGLVLTSEDEVCVGDIFYHDGELHKCIEISGGVIAENGIRYHSQPYSKVVALSNEIGYSYNRGPIHDHNHSWRDGVYLEDFNDGVARKLYEMHSVYVLVSEQCLEHGLDCSCKSGFVIKPILHDGKIIMDTYDITGNESYYFHN